MGYNGRADKPVTNKIQRHTLLMIVLIISVYGKYPKISNTKWSDKMAYANSADPDQTAPDQGLHCLPFR